jgi:hypothetical protein
MSQDDATPALHARLRAILEQVEKRVDRTLSKGRCRNDKFRYLMMDLHNARACAKLLLADCQDGQAAFAPAYEYEALLEFPKMVELLLRMNDENTTEARARSRGPGSRGGDAQARRAGKLFDEKRAAYPKSIKDTAIKAEIARDLDVVPSTVTRLLSKFRLMQ